MKKMNLQNKILFIFIFIGSMYYAVSVLREQDLYQFLIVITVIPVILFPYLIQRIGRIKIPNMLESLYMIFIFLGYFLGSIMKFYGKIPFYDLIIHFISGILSAMVAYYLYKVYNRKGGNLFTVIFFVLGITALIAVSWEIFEFVCDKIFKKNAQHVIESGVDDTMTDMIVALFGAVLYNLLYILYTVKKKGVLMKKYIEEVDTCYERT